MLPLDKYPSFAEDLFTFKFVKIFEANQKILHKISTLLLRNEKYRVNKFAKSNEPPTNFSYTDSSPSPATWMANKNAKNTHFWTNERDSAWRVAIVSVPWIVHEYHRATIVSRLLYIRPWTSTENNRNSWKWGFLRLLLTQRQEENEKWWRLKNKLIALLCVIC